MLQRRGTWVTTAEILRDVPSIVHSRIADLRKRGHDIQHRTTGVGAAGSEYRLVALGESARSPAAADSPSALSEREVIETSQPEPSLDIPAARFLSTPGGAGTREDEPRLSLTERAALHDWPASTSPRGAHEGPAEPHLPEAGQLNLIDIRRSWPPRQTCAACGQTFFNRWAHEEGCLGR
jgi:hypothetical protein